MRRLNLVFALFVPLLVSVTVLANDEPAQSKPIKPASAKDDTASSAAPSFISASAKEEAKAASKALRGGRETKAEKAERLKEEQAAGSIPKRGSATGD